MVLCSNAVKLTAEILHKEAYRFVERTDEIKTLQTTKTGWEGKTALEDLEADISLDYKQEAAIVSP